MPIGLEKFLIKPKDWNKAPPEAQAIAKKSSKGGVPTGIAYDPRNGWYVICSAGQGPFVIWSEHGHED